MSILGGYTVMKVNKRSLKLPNEILKDENIATMNLYNKKGEVVAFTIFDVEHIEKNK